MHDSKSLAYSEPGRIPVIAEETERARPAVKVIALLAAGHLVIDVTQGALPALLPFLKVAHNLSYAAAGSIVLAANVSGSIIQPFFGYLADRAPRRWMLPLSVLVAGLGMALTGVASSYYMLLALVVVMGFGVAAYHPEGYKSATSVAGNRKATALSWFSVGGNIGIALGPPFITTLVAGFGLRGSLGIFLPCVFVATLLVSALPRLSRSTQDYGASHSVHARGTNMPGAMFLLIFVVMIRSWVHLGFMTFLPFYYIDYLKADPTVVGPLLFVFLGAGAVGTVCAGPIADRWGARRFMRVAFLASAPLAILFLMVGGAAAFVVLGFLGAVLISTFAVTVVLGQSYLPRHAGMASGLIVGFAIGTGGLGAALLGWIADHFSLLLALWITALMPILGFIASLFLPQPRPLKPLR